MKTTKAYKKPITAFITGFIFVLATSCTKDQIQTESDEQSIFVNPNEVIAGDHSSSLFLFTDITPDTLHYSHSQYNFYDLDLNNDGDIDFIIEAYTASIFAGSTFSSSHIAIIPQGDDNFISMDNSLTWPKIYNLNDTIRNVSNWSENEATFSSNGIDSSISSPPYSYIAHGPWFGINNKYLGVKIGEDKLGWVKVTLPTNNPSYVQGITIQEYGVIN